MADAFEHIQSTYSLDLSDGTWLEELKDKARTRAADYIEAMGGVPADNGWQDISTAPKDGTPVIVRCDIDGDYIVVAQWFESSEFGGYAWTDFGVSDWGMQEFRQLNPTHWRPLPTPPTEKDMA